MIQIVIHHNNERTFVSEDTSQIPPEKLEFLLQVYKRLEGVRVSSEVKEVIDSVDQNTQKNFYKEPTEDEEEKELAETPTEEQNAKEGTLNEI